MYQIHAVVNEFIRGLTHEIKSAGLPIQTFELIGQDNPFDGQALGKLHLERVTFFLPSDGTYDGESGDCVESLRR